MVEKRRVAGTDTFLLTKDTGSPRYMAPEVFKGVPYNDKCDIYSWALILWQCLELTQPFNNYDVKRMAKDVYNGNVTPKLNGKWSPRLKALLNTCWLRDIKSRFNGVDVLSELKAELSSFDGDVMGELDVSNRTEASLKEMKTLRL